MRSHEVLDADEDARESRNKRRHRLLRFGAPVASVLLMAAGLIATALYSYQRDRADRLALSQDLLAVVDRQVRLEVSAYLAPAKNAVRTLAAAAMERPLDPANRTLLERLGMQLLVDAPMVAVMSVGDPRGNYMMLRRNELGGIDTKLMEREGGRVSTTWTRRDATNQVVATEPDPTDEFDPRTRPWYKDAVAAEDISWTDAYVFFTDKKPGVTASLPVRDGDGNITAVIGVDIFLDELSKFLASLRISRRSESLIVDEHGGVIAHRQTALVGDEGAELRLARIQDLDLPLVTQAYDRLRVSGPGRSMVGIDEQQYIILGSSLMDIVDRNWMLLFVVPESDFVESVARNTRTALILFGSIIAIALLLAFFLIRQGLATDRMAGVLKAREQAMEQHDRAFAELGEFASQPDPAKRLPRFTETLARATNAGSVSVWRFEADGTVLCLHSYDLEARSHTAGIEIDPRQCPELFTQLLTGQDVMIDDVTEDERLAGIRNLYAAQASGRNLVLIPFAQDDTVGGYLALEALPLPAARRDATLLLIRTFARWLAPRLQDAETTAGSSEHELPMRRSGVTPTPLRAATESLRTTSLMEDRERLALQNVSNGRNTSDIVFPQILALNLRIRDDALLLPQDEPRNGAAPPITDVVRNACDRHSVRYVKILGNDIVIAEGFDGDVDDAAGRLASVALDLRDHCTAFSRHRNREASFSMGFDCGSALGAASGASQGAFNLWGEAIRVAQALAATAAAGTIQVSQTAYAHLNSRFLFRQAGAYYLDHIGEMATFTLRGRL